ncbi:MAG: hypothetical protein MSG64_03065, partial [Pyrinomonadaceae bacterium MAG19_C2-C3]|nr:hypothetical protein [Pyrinomonadaceae bacterium MAG19_C2-C3]
MKAPTGRPSIARRIAPGHRSISDSALKGRHNYVALSGLANNMDALTCGVATGYRMSPLRGFSNSFLEGVWKLSLAWSESFKH